MLYNKDWDKHLKVDNKSKPFYISTPWTLAHLIGWLSSKHGPYNYLNSSNCLIAQYANELGYKNVRVTTASVSWREKRWLIFSRWRAMNLPPHFNEIAQAGTFEKAYHKALSLL